MNTFFAKNNIKAGLVFGLLLCLIVVPFGVQAQTTSWMAQTNTNTSDNSCFVIVKIGSCGPNVNTDGSKTSCTATSLASDVCTITYSDNSTKTITNNDLDFSKGITGTVTTVLKDPSGNTISSSGQSEGGAAVSGATTALINAGTKAITNPDIMNAFGNAIKSAAAPVFGSIALVILTLSANILSIVGFLFNGVINFTVFQFGVNFGNSQGLLLAWGVLRDIGNILLLFGFIYLGIMMILDLPHGIDTRKAIPSLLIYALLLNFSLFAAETVIDLSNILCASLFSSAAQNTANGTGIADQVIQSSGIGSIFSPGQSTATGFQNLLGGNDPGHTAVVYIGAAIFVTITAIVLLAASIMLLIRGIVLTLVMVTAPIGFAAMAIPQFSGFAKQWWKYLLSNAFFAPVFLLLVYISLTIMKGFQTALGSQSLLNALMSPSTKLSTVFLSFALMTAFMIAALMSAKSLGGVGADYATKTAGGVVLGGQSFIARRTVGRASYMAAQGLRNSNNKFVQGFVRSELGRGVVTNLDKGGKASFDVRGAKIPGLDKVGLGSVPKGGSHGWEGYVHAGEKERVDYGKTLRDTPAEKERAKKLQAEKEAAEKWKSSDEREAAQAAIDQMKEGIKTNADSRAKGVKSQEEKIVAAQAAVTAQQAKSAEATAAVTQQEAVVTAAQAAVAAKQAEYDQMVASGALIKDTGPVRAEIVRLQAAQEEAQQGLTEARAISQREADAVAPLTQAVVTETETLTRMQQESAAAATQEAQNVTTLETRLKELDAAKEKLAKGLGEQINAAKNAAVTQYTNNLHNPDAIGRFINLTTAAGAASHHAHDKLKREINKTENDKLVDSINAAKESIAKAGGGGGGGHGGGAPAPKPAGGAGGHGGGGG